MTQLDLFRKPSGYVGWRPDKSSAPAYAAEWELWHAGRSAGSVRAPLFTGASWPAQCAGEGRT
jgi:hypothetical protein